MTERPRPCGVRRTHQNAVRNTNAQRNTDAPLYEKKPFVPLGGSISNRPAVRGAQTPPNASTISTTPSPSTSDPSPIATFLKGGSGVGGEKDKGETGHLGGCV